MVVTGGDAGSHCGGGAHRAPLTATPPLTMGISYDFFLFFLAVVIADVCEVFWRQPRPNLAIRYTSLFFGLSVKCLKFTRALVGFYSQYCHHHRHESYF